MKQKDLQIEYDSVMKEFKSLNKKKKEIVDRVKENGFAIFGGKIKEDSKVYGAFYDLDFYSHFDGHLSEAIYYQESGAEEITKESFDILKSLIRKHEEQGHDDSGEIEGGIIDLGFGTEHFVDARDFLEHFNIIDEDTVRWEYHGSSSDSELSDESYVEVRLSTKSAIKAVKQVDTRWD